MKRRPNRWSSGYAGVLLVALAALAALAWTPREKNPPKPTTRVILPDDSNFVFVGHWDKSHLSEQAVTVNSGARILCSFTGHSVRGMFGIKGITAPAEVYVSIDGSSPLFYRADTEIVNFTPVPLKGARHRLEIDVKDVDERINRWNPPLESALVFQGLVVDRKAQTLPPPPLGTLKMEFYGDSITQGVALLSRTIGPEGSDGTKDYAFLTALAFDAVHNQIGFGRQGVIRDGNGNVPPAPQSFGWNFRDSPADRSFVPDVVVVNQGTNDQSYPSERFEPAYQAYIEQIRKAYPAAAIFCMRTFGGFHEADIKAAVEAIHDPRIFYVDTTGWLDKSDYTDGVHPSAAGHVKAARQLVEAISAHTGLKAVHEIH